MSSEKYWQDKAEQDKKNQKAIILQNLLNRATEIAIHNAKLDLSEITEEKLSKTYDMVIKIFADKIKPKK